MKLCVSASAMSSQGRWCAPAITRTSRPSRCHAASGVIACADPGSCPAVFLSRDSGIAPPSTTPQQGVSPHGDRASGRVGIFRGTAGRVDRHWRRSSADADPRPSFRYSDPEAIGTSLVAVITTSAASSSVHLQRHTTDIRLGMTLELATSLGAAVTAYLVGYFNRNALEGLFAAFLLYSADHDS